MIQPHLPLPTYPSPLPTATLPFRLKVASLTAYLEVSLSGPRSMRPASTANQAATKMFPTYNNRSTIAVPVLSLKAAHLEVQSADCGGRESTESASRASMPSLPISRARAQGAQGRFWGLEPTPLSAPSACCVGCHQKRLPRSCSPVPRAKTCKLNPQVGYANSQDNDFLNRKDDSLHVTTERPTGTVLGLTPQRRV